MSLSLEDIIELIGETGVREAYARLRKLVPRIPADLLNERVRVGLNSYLHAAAIWAKGQRRKHRVSDEVFRRNLGDMFLGALVAPF